MDYNKTLLTDHMSQYEQLIQSVSIRQNIKRSERTRELGNLGKGLKLVLLLLRKDSTGYFQNTEERNKLASIYLKNKDLITNYKSKCMMQIQNPNILIWIKHQIFGNFQ